MSTADLDRRPPQEALVTQDAGAAWSKRQMALIARTVAKDASAEELHFFLNVASRYNLDPFQGEIYCSKLRGKNGGEGRIAIIVGEQGRLKIANRYPDYLGFNADVVCANDRFIRLPEPKEVPGAPGCWTRVEHSYSMAGSSESGRGEILGGYCEVYRDGRPAVFFFAPLAEYAPDPEKVTDRARDFIPWFSTESRMIVKCAISTGFRMAFNLAGIYGEEELAHVREAEVKGEVSIEDEIEWGESDETAEYIRSLFTAANNAKEGSFPPAKIRLLLSGLTDEDRMELAVKTLLPFIEVNGGTVPEPGETVVADADTEIVQDGEHDAEQREDLDEGFDPLGGAGDEPQSETLPGV